MAVYIVKAGDTLSSIAKKLGYSNWQDLYTQNKEIIGPSASKNLNLRNNSQLTYTQGGPSAGTSAGAQAGQATALTPFGEVLPWEQYFNPELARGSSEQVYANYYAPLVQQAQGNLENDYANRGLTRSGMRGQALSDMYGQYGQEQQAGIESDIYQQKAMAQDDYSRMQQLYENTEGKQKPQTSTYSPYKVAKPTTSAGTYGSSYLDWLNRVTRV